MKESLSRRLTVYFLIIMVLTVVLSVAWNYYSTRQSILVMEKRVAEGCARSVSSLLDHYGYALEESEDSKEYNFLRHAVYNFCEGFGQEAIYLYSFDPMSGSRSVLLAVEAGEGTDTSDSREAKGFPLSELERSNVEADLESGEEEQQRAVYRTTLEDAVLWVARYTDPDLQEPLYIAMEISIALEYGYILRDFTADILLPVIALAISFLTLNLMIRKRVTAPIRLLSDRMNRYAHSTGEPFEPLRIPNKDEIGEIATAFEAMTQEITSYIGNIERLTKERVESNVELDIARRIQYGLVPAHTSFNGDGFRISAMTRPAKAVGGDFYDCFRRENGDVCIVMGDVSGKGITGAIFMAVIKTTIREKLKLGLSPAQALNRTNQELMAQNPEGFFVTVFAAVLDPCTGELRYANAGHTYPLLLGDPAGFLQPYEGTALGLFDDAQVRDEAMKLLPGEGIVLYTDGLTDALNTRRISFGMERLLETVKEIPNSPDAADDVLERIDETVRAYCEGVEPFDDMAVLVLTAVAVPAGEMMREIPVSLSSFATVKEAVFALCGDTPLSRKALLACDEALSNIVRHSGADMLAFGCTRPDEELCVVFSDNGIAFDPTAGLASEKEFEQLDSGGMGLNLIRQTASSVHYERRDEKNVLTLRFSA